MITLLSAISLPAVVGTAMVNTNEARSGARHVQASCSSGCPETQFCDIYGRCSDYTCSNWFQFGTWTRLDDADVTASGLTCTEYESETLAINHAVVYYCGSYEGTPLPDVAVVS